MSGLPVSTLSFCYPCIPSFRLTLVFFCIGGLDLLSKGSSYSYLDEKEKKEIIEWIYSMQLDCQKQKGPGEDKYSHKQFVNPILVILSGRYGFRGSNSCGVDHRYDFGSLAMTYSALATLLILGDDLSRVDRQSLKEGLRELQLDSGRLYKCEFLFFSCSFCCFLSVFFLC